MTDRMNNTTNHSRRSENAEQSRRANGRLEDASRESHAAFSNFSGKSPLEIDDIVQSLKRLTGGWPKCVSGSLCYMHKEELRVLEDAAALFAWIGGHGEVNWRGGPRAVTKMEFFKRLHQGRIWDWATAYPHFPPIPNVYYLKEPPAAKHTGKLDELLDRFLPKTEEDRELIRAFILTLCWGGPPGKRPQFAFVADESADLDAGRGSGKSSVPQYISGLFGGCIDVDHGSNNDRILTNLLSPDALNRRVALLDNLKSTRFSNEFLEKCVTRDELTGHRLYRGFTHRKNYLTWVVTVNGAFFSTDDAMRTVVVRVTRPSSRPSNWDQETRDFIDDNRDEIIADVRWYLEVREPARLTSIDRWGPWCMEVLSKCNFPNRLLRHIREQRVHIDADKLEIGLALDQLRSSICAYFDGAGNKHALEHIDESYVWAPTAWYVMALRALKHDSSPHQTQRFLSRLKSTGRLSESRRPEQRGYLWFGENYDAENPIPVVPLEISYLPEVTASRRRK